MTNFEKLLNEKNISRYMLAKLVGVTPSSLNFLWTGKTSVLRMNLGTAYKIAKVLGMTMEEFLFAAKADDDVILTEGWNQVDENLSVLISEGSILKGIKDGAEVVPYKWNERKKEYIEWKYPKIKDLDIVRWEPTKN